MTNRRALLASLLLALGACTGEAGAPSPSAAADSRFRLATEPAGAVSVVAAKAEAPKEDSVVLGRVKEVSPGVAAFVIVDASLPYCGERAGTDDACETPWDYCCEDPGEVAKKSVAVAVRTGSGGLESAAIPELRSLDLVVVKGRLTKNDKGDVELAATGWYRKERPKVSEKIKFP